MKTPPPLDAVFITYGCGPLTWLALQTLVSTTPVARIVVVDNGAGDPDLTHARLRPYLERHGGVYIPRPDNPGVYTALNEALYETRARYVLVASSDTFPMPGWWAPVHRALDVGGRGWVGPGEVARTFDLSLPWAALADEVEGEPEWRVLDQPNSAFGVLDWHRLRDAVGWFDESFFYCYGDTDYFQRMYDVGILPGTIAPPRVLHLVQQSRRQRPAEENVAREMRDEDAFHAKWAARPDVLARHPRQTREERMAWWAQANAGVPS